MNQILHIANYNINNYRNLNNETNEELIKKYKTGDYSIKETLVENNLKLVLSICRKYSKKADMDDLFQIGCVGLLKAIENFDIDKGFLFSTYAYSLILGEIKIYVRDQSSTVKINRQLKDIFYKVLSTKEENQNFEDINLEIIAEKIQVPLNLVKLAIEAHQETISIFQPTNSGSGDDMFIIDQLSDKTDNYEDLINNMSLYSILENLKERDKNIIDLRYFQNKTQGEVAATLGISQAQVSRLEKTVLENMRYELTC